MSGAQEPSALKELRVDLVNAVTGITTYTHVPGRANVPCAFVLAGSPYIEGGETFAESLVRFELVLLTQPSLNGPQTDDLDLLILKSSAELAAAGWRVESVSQPRIEEINGGEVLATGINVAALVTFD